MARLPVLDLLSNCIKDFEPRLDPGYTIDVLPVAVASLPAVNDIISSTVRSVPGLYLNAAEMLNGAATRINPEFVRHVTETAEEAGLGPDLVITFEQKSPDFSHCLLNGSSAPTPNGHRALVGLMNALLELAGTSHDFGCVAYEDASLDIRLRQFVWTFLTSVLPRVGIGRIKKLLVVLGTGKLQPDPYLVHPKSVLYMIEDDSLLKRNKPLVNKIELQYLTQQSHKSPLVLFLGAGASFSSKLPLGNELRAEALTSLMNPSGSRSEESVLIQEFLEWIRARGRTLGSEDKMSADQFRGQLTLERVLREEFYVRGGPGASPTLEYFRHRNSRALDTPGASILHLRRIVEHAYKTAKRRVVLATVNFDTLVEGGGSEHVRVFASEDDFLGAADYLSEFINDGGPVPYLKLHGSIEQPESIVASTEQTLTGLSAPKAAAVGELLPQSGLCSWIYVGCSMRDLDLRPLFASPSFRDRVDERWVAPFVDPHVREFAETCRYSWKARGVYDFESRVITDTADVFLKQIEDHISSWT